MKRFEERRQFRRFLYSIPALLALLVLIFILSRATWRSFLGAELAEDNVSAVRYERSELIKRTTALQDDLKKLESERGMEEVVRDKFAVGKEGEKVIILVDDKDGTANDAEGKATLWQKFLNIFTRN